MSDSETLFETKRQIMDFRSECEPLETLQKRPQSESVTLRVAKMMRTPNHAPLAIDDERCGRIYARLTEDGYVWKRVNDTHIRVWKPLYPLPLVVRKICSIALLIFLQWLGFIPTAIAEILLIAFIVLSSQ